MAIYDVHGNVLSESDVVVDNTLTREGQAADAKETGDRLDSLSEEISGGSTSGKDGGYYTPSVTQPDENAMRVSYTPSDSSMPEVASMDVTLPAGADGKSAYQYAQDGGYTGTETEFATKLAQELPTALKNPNALTFTGAVTGTYDGSAPLSVEIPSGGGDGGNKPTIIFDSGEITEEVNIIGPIDISKYSKIRIFGKAYPSANSSGKRAAQIYFQDVWKRLLCNAGKGKLFDTAGNPVSFLIYLDVGANAISTHSYSGFNASATFDDADFAVSSEANATDGGCLVYSTKFDLTQMHLSAQDDLSGRPWGVNTRIMVIGDA